MDFEFIWMIIQMLFALATILLLMLLTYKLTSKKVTSMNSQKYIKVLERVQISKDTYICVVKVGNKGHVISTSAGKTDVIQQLTEEEVLEIENKKMEELQKMQGAYEGAIESGKSIIERVKSKYILKGDTNEE